MSKSSIFICSECGKIHKLNLNEHVEERIINKVCKCGYCLSMANSYPLLQVCDFNQSVELLMEKCKEQSKENLQNIKLLLKRDSIEVPDWLIYDFIKILEETKEIEKDNSPEYFTIIMDMWEQNIENQMSNSNENMSVIRITTGDYDGIISAILCYHKNRWRKPLIIMIAATLEQLLNDYEKECLIFASISNKSIYTRKDLYDKNNQEKHLSISKKIKRLTNSGYYKENIPFNDNWTKLRKLRNDIIHNNIKYITEEKVEVYYNLISEGIEIFANLKSELYQKKAGLKIEC